MISKALSRIQTFMQITEFQSLYLNLSMSMNDFCVEVFLVCLGLFFVLF